jgi:hypothetical protein
MGLHRGITIDKLLVMLKLQMADELFAGYPLTTSDQGH